MKNAAEHAKVLGQLLNYLARRVPKGAPPERSPVEQLIDAFLTYDATTVKAHNAYQRLMAQVVDLNDLRVTDPVDLAAIIGPNYPKVAERAQRLRAALNSIYRREHAVDLSSLADRPKKDVRAYLDTLDGTVPYVSATVTLLSFGGHAIPLDDRLYRKLIEDGIIEASATFEEAQSFLEHHIRFEDAIEAHQRLRAYADRDVHFQAPAAGRSRRPARKTTPRKTKKTTRRARASR